MKEAINAGLNFGLTSGVITTLGLMVGLHSGTHSTLAVIGGLATIAVADSMSDALGIHISKEGEANTSKREVWVATIVTLVSKMLVAITFVVPVLVFELATAILVSIAWGLIILCAVSYVLAKRNGESPLYVIGEHVVIALFVVVAAHYVGELISSYFA